MGATEFFSRERRIGLVQFHHGMKYPLQTGMAHVANENPTAGSHERNHLLENVHEIIHVGKVLDDRVEDHGVERAGSQGLELVSASAVDLSLGQVARGQFAFDSTDGRLRKIDANVTLALGSDPKQ